MMLKNSKSLIAAVSIVVLAAIVAGCSKEARQAGLLEEAENYFAEGNLDAARIEYLNLLREDGGNVRAISRIGEIYFSWGAPLLSLEYLVKTRELDPGNLDSRVRLASTLFTIGATKEAKAEIDAVLEQSPGHSEALLLFADSAVSGEEIEALERHLEKLKESEKSAAISLASATLAVHKKDFASAEKAIEDAMLLEPDSPHPHTAKGRLFLGRNEAQSAEKEFLAAAELSPLRSPARLNYAKLKAAMGDGEEAAAYLNGVLEEVPDYLSGWIQYGAMAFADKRYDEAIKRLDNVFGRDSMNFEARLLAARCYLAKKEAAKAQAGLERMKDAYPNSPVVRLLLAYAYLGQADTKRAEESARASLKLDPNSAGAIQLLARFDLNRGDAQKVITAMTGLLDAQPGNAEAQVLLAEAYTAVGRLEDAARIYRARIESDPSDARSHLVLGVIRRMEKKSAEARASFEKAQELAPADLVPTFQLIELDLAEGEYDAAAERVRAQREREPDSAGVSFLEGKIHAARKEWGAAEVALKKAIELQKDLGSAYSLLISVYLATNRLSEAAGELDRVLEINPRNVRALITSAMIHDALGDVAKVQSCYEKVLVEDPDSVAALNNLAYIYAEKLDRVDDAYELALKARALLPDDAGVADTLGWILFKKGKFEQALTLLQEGVRGLPENPEVQYHIGMASYMMGRAEEAREAFERAVASEAAFPGKDEARKRLADFNSAAGGGEELAVGDMEAILAERPEDVVLRLRLGAAYEKEGRSREASEMLEAAIKVNPQLPEALKSLARLYGGPLENREKAVEFAKEARRISPDDPEAAAILGKLVFENGDLAWGYSLLQESALKLAGKPEFLIDFAWAAYSQNRVEEAMDAMRRVTEQAPGSGWAVEAENFLNLAPYSIGPWKGDVASIESAAKALLKDEPAHALALMVVASAETRRGNAAAAIEAYEKVLDRFPAFAPAQKRLAALYARDPKRLDEAHALAAEARKVLRDDAEMARTLGEISFKRGEYAYALQLLDESARTQPLDAEALYYAGTAHLRLDHPAKGAAALKLAIESGLDGPLLGQAEKELSRLSLE